MLFKFNTLLNTQCSKQGLLGISLGMILSCSFLSAAQAEEVYKIVGKDGSISYSNEPPSESTAAEVIEVAPEPSPEAVLAAQEELKKVQAENLAQQNAAAEKVEASAQSIETEKSGKKKAPKLESNPLLGLAPFL